MAKLYLLSPSEILLLRKLKSAELKQSRIAADICKLELSNESTLTRKTIDRIETGDKAWSIDSEIIYVETIKKHKLKLA